MIATTEIDLTTTYVTNDRALKPPEVGLITGFSIKTLANWRVLGRGPPFRIVNGRVRYMESSTYGWLQSHREQRSTSDSALCAGVLAHN
jgi:predicted DNA-binding transcriptional regulator AlpA